MTPAAAGRRGQPAAPVGARAGAARPAGPLGVLTRPAVQVVAGAAAVVAIALTADWGSVGRAARALAADPAPLGVAVAAYGLAFVLRAAAWGPLLPAPVPLRRRVRALLGMLAVNHALPGPVGELARARLVAGHPGVGFRAALVSVGAARVVDLGALGLLAMAGAAAAGDGPGWLRAAAPLGAVLPVAAWALARRRGFPLRPGKAARVAAWAVPSWALEAGIVAVIARSAGIEVSVAGAVLAMCGGVMAQVAAVLPGGVGTYEAGMASVLVALGAPVGEAVGVATTTHAVTFAFAFAAGGPALLAARRRDPTRPAPPPGRRRAHDHVAHARP